MKMTYWLTKTGHHFWDSVQIQSYSTPRRFFTQLCGYQVLTKSAIKYLRSVIYTKIRLDWGQRQLLDLQMCLPRVLLLTLPEKKCFYPGFDVDENTGPKLSSGVKMISFNPGLMTSTQTQNGPKLLLKIMASWPILKQWSGLAHPEFSYLNT